MNASHGAWRNAILALAITLLTLPLQMTAATKAHAQTNPPTSSAAGAGSVTPGLAFNYLGVEHTATFTCSNAGPAGPVPAGCYGITGSAQNATGGVASAIIRATCSGATAEPTTSSVQCAFLPTGASSTVTINPGAPDVYIITFSGYVPAVAGVCPAGTGVGATANTGGTPTPGAITTTPAGAAAPLRVAGCAFVVLAQKKYVEITGFIFTGGPCGGAMIWSEGLKAFLGPACTITVTAVGLINIKPVPDCAAELVALSNPGTTAAVVAEFGPSAAYVCTNNMLGVSGVSSNLLGAPGLPITITPTGLGASNGITLASGGTVYCTGVAGPVTIMAGTPIMLCPTGSGTASIIACTTSSIGTQPRICGAAAGLDSSPGTTSSWPTVSATATPSASPTPTATVYSGTMATVAYGAGWRQVGGPAGSNFGAAGSLFSYNPVTNTYADADSTAASLSSAAPACIGYWAYTTVPMSVTIQAATRSGDTATCTLAKGWNMIGNPFASPAQLPVGVSGYSWNGTSYEVGTVIPAGGALWVANMSDAQAALILTAR